METLKEDIVFNTINNGILIVDEQLNIKAWNRWLAVHTHLSYEDVIDKNLCSLFSSIDEKRLKRKIKSVLVMNTSSFYSVDPHRYLIKIPLSNITNPIYDSMQQDVTIAPYKKDEKLVVIYIYDKTVLCETNAKLEKLNDELRELSYKDPMTNAYNRRFFYEECEKLMTLANRNDKNCCIIILDIDKFKDVNDMYGHDVGDEVIIKLAHFLKDNVRQSDIVARFGGEEFVIFLYDVHIKDATKLAKSLQERLALVDMALKNGKKFNFTASFGVAKFHKDIDDNNIEHTISRADKCLYIAKEEGRNRVISEAFLNPIDEKKIDLKSNIFMLNE